MFTVLAYLAVLGFCLWLVEVFRPWFDLLVEFVRILIRAKVKPEPAPPFTYYDGSAITAAVEDVWSPIEKVIRAVEQQCEHEERCSESYRAKPVHQGHPWAEFVGSGDAEYLGWSKGHVFGSYDAHRRRSV